MKRKVQISILSLLLSASFLMISSCKNSDTPWTWAKKLQADDSLSGSVWYSDKVSPLQQDELSALTVLLNKLERSSFTENSALAGSTPEYGLMLNADGSILINQADEAHGTVEMKYGGKQWWVKNKALADYIRKLGNPSYRAQNAAQG